MPFSFLDPLFNMASLKGLILITLAIIQAVQCITPTIGFISPDIVADIGKDEIFVETLLIIIH